jgi:outer membrane lipoprotein-sorting protein
MSRLSLRLLALAALFFGVGGAAVPAEIGVEEILTRYAAARGGLERIRRIQSLRMTGTIAFDPAPASPFKLEMKRPNKMRTEFRFAGATGVQAFDGRQAWVVMPMAGKSEPEFLPEEASREAAEQADIEGMLIDAAAKGTKVAYVGPSKVAGRDCHKLSATLKSGSVRYVYLDAATFLEAKSEGRRRAGGEEVMIETLSQDYREVDGLKVPFMLEAGPAGRPERQRIVLEKVEFEVPIEDRRFQASAPAR